MSVYLQFEFVLSVHHIFIHHLKILEIIKSYMRYFPCGFLMNLSPEGG